jgi:2-oxoglutarate ferredoxin oxidoreductase subunit alpha
MPKNDMTFKIGGEAGQGIESSGAGFAKVLARGGLYVFGLQDYMSRIRGGHNFYQIRVSDRPLYAPPMTSIC